MWKQTRRRTRPPRRSVRLWLTGGLLLVFIVVAGVLVWVGGAIVGGVRGR